MEQNESLLCLRVQRSVPPLQHIAEQVGSFDGAELSDLTGSISTATDNAQRYITGIKYSEAQYMPGEVPHLHLGKKDKKLKNKIRYVY